MQYLMRIPGPQYPKIVQLFRQRDVYYFLFNPPTEFDHPSQPEWQNKYLDWDEYQDVPKSWVPSGQVLPKYRAVIDALTLWESGDSGAIASMTAEQLGYVMVFHPEYPNSPWNHPTQCQDIAISGNTYIESFCRWRTLIHFSSFEGFPQFPSETLQTFERLKNLRIFNELTSGKTYGEITQSFVPD